MTRKFYFLFTLLLLAVCGNTFADSFTIAFTAGTKTATAIQTSTQKATVIADSLFRDDTGKALDYFGNQPFSDITNAYYGKSTYALRLGVLNTAKTSGSITFTFDGSKKLYVDSIVVNAHAINNSATLSVNGHANKAVTYSSNNFTFKFDCEEMKSFTLSSENATYINSIKVYYGATGRGASLTSLMLAEGVSLKKQYMEGDNFDTSGMTAIGIYSNGEIKTIQSPLTWVVTPDPLATGTTSVELVASIQGVTSAPYIVNGLTVYSKGSKEEPITVEEAFKYIKLFKSISGVYIKGIVTSNTGKITEGRTFYRISDDGTQNNELRITNGLSYNGENFTTLDDIEAGKYVTVYGDLGYSNENEIVEKNSQLVDSYSAAVIDENADEYIPEEGISNVIVKRTFTPNCWNTFAVPFDITAEQIAEVFGAETKVAKLVSDTEKEDGSYTLNFATATSIEANVPVLIWGVSNAGPYLFKDVDVKVSTDSYDDNDDEVDFYETTSAYTETENCVYSVAYAKYTVAEAEANTNSAWYIASDNKFYQVKGGETFKITTGMFAMVSSAFAAKGLTFSIDNEVTAVDSIQTETKVADAPLYNLAGQKVGKDYKGVVIQNGKKFILK